MPALCDCSPFRRLMHRIARRAVLGWVAAMACGLALTAGAAAAAQKPEFDYEKLPCCDYHVLPAIVWSGSDPVMSFQKLAQYCGPILWFSPDEPLLREVTSDSIRIATSFPFEAKAD